MCRTLISTAGQTAGVLPTLLRLLDEPPERLIILVTRNSDVLSASALAVALAAKCVGVVPREVEFFDLGLEDVADNHEVARLAIYVKELLLKYRTPPRCVDVTGGRKPESAAAILAAEKLGVRILYCHVPGDEYKRCSAVSRSAVRERRVDCNAVAREARLVELRL